MSIWGRVIGGAAGLAVGGPIGALVGLALGAAVDKGVEAVRPSDEATRHITFTIGVIALSAKMAKADGIVTREEVDAFKRVFRVPAHEMKNVGRVFDLARQSTAGFEAYAKQIADLLHDKRSVLSDLLEGLFFIALADGEMHPNEMEFLRAVAKIFGFSVAEFEKISSRHVGPDANSPYVILGVDPDIDDEALKKHYRRLVMDNHPDTMMASGVPSDLIAVATERVAQINVAYDTIMEDRGLR